MIDFYHMMFINLTSLILNIPSFSSNETGYLPCLLFVLSFRYFSTVASAMITENLKLLRVDVYEQTNRSLPSLSKYPVLSLTTTKLKNF